EAGPRPDIAPRVAGEELLPLGVERRPPRQRPLDVRVAQDLAADGHPALQPVIAHMRPSFSSDPDTRRAPGRRAPAPPPGSGRGPAPPRSPPAPAGPAPRRPSAPGW